MTEPRRPEIASAEERLRRFRWDGEQGAPQVIRDLTPEQVDAILRAAADLDEEA